MLDICLSCLAFVFYMYSFISLSYQSCEGGTVVIPALQIRSGTVESMRSAFPSHQQMAELGFNFSSANGPELLPVTPYPNAGLAVVICPHTFSNISLFHKVFLKAFETALTCWRFIVSCSSIHPCQHLFLGVTKMAFQNYLGLKGHVFLSWICLCIEKESNEQFLFLYPIVQQTTCLKHEIVIMWVCLRRVNSMAYW